MVDDVLESSDVSKDIKLPKKETTKVKDKKKDNERNATKTLIVKDAFSWLNKIPDKFRGWILIVFIFVCGGVLLKGNPFAAKDFEATLTTMKALSEEVSKQNGNYTEMAVAVKELVVKQDAIKEKLGAIKNGKEIDELKTMLLKISSELNSMSKSVNMNTTALNQFKQKLKEIENKIDEHHKDNNE